MKISFLPGVGRIYSTCEILSLRFCFPKICVYDCGGRGLYFEGPLRTAKGDEQVVKTLLVYHALFGCEVFIPALPNSD